jgi:hypothetical protein
VLKLPFFIIASVLFLSNINNAFSFYLTGQEGCTSVDLRTHFPLKMRNQGDISWCYAHAAADYLQFYNKIPVQISAADIAVNYNKRRWPRLLKWLRGGVVPETGFIRSAIFDISSIGYCSEDYFPSETWTKRIMTGDHAGETVQVPLEKAVQEIFNLVHHVEAGFYLIPSDLPFVYEFKGLSHQAFYDAVFTNPTGSVLDELRSAACDSHRLPFPKDITGMVMNFKGKNAFSQINDVLNQHSAVTVDFFYGFLENIDQYKTTIGELHTTLLMGRRFNSNSNECQYLIKNSYGTDCTSYDHRHQCEDGYVWVSEASLYRAMTSFVYISGSEDHFSGTAQQIQDEQDFQSSSIVR